MCFNEHAHFVPLTRLPRLTRNYGWNTLTDVMTLRKKWTYITRAHQHHAHTHARSPRQKQQKQLFKVSGARFIGANNFTAFINTLKRKREVGLTHFQLRSMCPMSAVFTSAPESLAMVDRGRIKALSPWRDTPLNPSMIYRLSLCAGVEGESLCCRNKEKGEKLGRY